MGLPRKGSKCWQWAKRGEGDSERQWQRGRYHGHCTPLAMGAARSQGLGSRGRPGSGGDVRLGRGTAGAISTTAPHSSCLLPASPFGGKERLGAGVLGAAWGGAAAAGVGLPTSWGAGSSEQPVAVTGNHGQAARPGGAVYGERPREPVGNGGGTEGPVLNRVPTGGKGALDLPPSRTGQHTLWWGGGIAVGALRRPHSHPCLGAPLWPPELVSGAAAGGLCSERAPSSYPSASHCSPGRGTTFPSAWAPCTKPWPSAAGASAAWMAEGRALLASVQFVTLGCQQAVEAAAERQHRVGRDTGLGGRFLCPAVPVPWARALTPGCV
ncbi:hypothetical protein KIL84_022290 [Mauremys mutica]|uniref:Uncharacterized protein n=1 Tax=Mauremys mutica TaxID=74926 RepID=A0A9D3XAP7_9SAUR|nr:hypothetical protein KIL84_022290 [Mauremys mutica]